MTEGGRALKRRMWGNVVGGAVAAAFAAAGVAGATGDTWTPDYDVDNAQLLVGPSSSQEAWELPASFTSSSGTTLTGTDYLSSAPGGIDDEFITAGGAVYDQDQLFPGVTNLYYAPVDGDAVDMMKTPFGTIDLSSMASTFAPGDVEQTFFPAAEVGQNVVVGDLSYDSINQALHLDGDSWAGGLPADGTITAMQAPDSSLVWAAPTTYVGPDATALTGTLYVTSPTDVEFVDQAGDVFDQRELVSGLIPVENLYYAPVDGPVQDHLQTIFGDYDISSIAFWFAPTDVSDLAVADSPAADLADAGLYSALDLGLTS